MRTQDEIVQRYTEAKERDLLGFEADEYLVMMDFAHAKPLLQPEVTESEWLGLISTAEEVDTRAKKYMTFWLSKIEGQRGISVCRGTMHYTAWKWMLGHPDSDTFPGSFAGGDGGWYQQLAYDYIKTQIEDGEWDRMTEEMKNE
jgi:hypothetical protein